MKKLLFILSFLLLFSCSKQESNCEAEEQALKEWYTEHLELAGNDQNNINALLRQLDAELAQVCN